MWRSHFVIFEIFGLLVPRGYYHILVKQMSAEQRDNDTNNYVSTISWIKFFKKTSFYSTNSEQVMVWWAISCYLTNFEHVELHWRASLFFWLTDWSIDRFSSFTSDSRPKIQLTYSLFSSSVSNELQTI